MKKTTSGAFVEQGGMLASGRTVSFIISTSTDAPTTYVGIKRVSAAT